MLPYGMCNSEDSDGSSPAPGLHMARAFILTGAWMKAGIYGASKQKVGGSLSEKGETNIEKHGEPSLGTSKHFLQEK